jgi:hypothetical protein
MITENRNTITLTSTIQVENYQDLLRPNKKTEQKDRIERMGSYHERVLFISPFGPNQADWPETINNPILHFIQHLNNSYTQKYSSDYGSNPFE